jgi:hypothetical protein
MKKFLVAVVAILLFGISFLSFQSNAIAGRQVIGKWQDSSGVLMGAVYEIYIEGGKIYLSSKYSDGSGGIDQLEKFGNRYREIGNELEWFIINSKGNLEIYDTMGLITTMMPIK